MANNRLYGYTPNPTKEKEGNRLDRLNPYEFRKGMDYELTAIGCSRLAESTPEEREKATETLIKNLQEHNGYYSALIQFEGGMDMGKKITETSFKKYLENYTSERGDGMVEVDKEIKNDKMIELKEAITKEIKNILSEKKDDDDAKDDKKASKGAKGKEKALKALDKDIDDLITKLKKRDSTIRKLRYENNKKNKHIELLESKLKSLQSKWYLKPFINIT